jgi:non-canonical purine NTP pyrophosphatase (RdgB/HAM1 family)
MISKIVLASNNHHKLTEIRFFLDPLGIQVLSLHDLGIDLPESIEKFSTYQENAAAKCHFVSIWTNLPVLADDSGLEILALDGRPGIISARYGGTGKDSDNRNKVLMELKKVPEEKRMAKFVCVLCFHNENNDYFFDGQSSGKILEKEVGCTGFGYDSLFFCDTYLKSYAELTFEEKLKVCHRGHALKKLVEWLQKTKIPKVGLEPTKGCPH